MANTWTTERETTPARHEQEPADKQPEATLRALLDALGRSATSAREAAR